MTSEEMRPSADSPVPGDELLPAAGAGQTTPQSGVDQDRGPDAVQPPVPVKTRSRRSTWLVAGGTILAVALLAGAAFTGARLISNGSQPAGPAGSGQIMIKGGAAGGKGIMSKRIDLERAPELPANEPDIRGVFTRREGNSVFLGTGKVSMMMKKDATTGSVSTAANYDGPVLEVVVTHNTQVFADVTPMQLNGNPEEKVKQVVKPGTIDDVDKNTLLSVWGERNGERIIARVLTYQRPGN